MGPNHCRREQCARPIGRGGVEPELPRVDDDGAAEDQKARGHLDGSFGRRGEQARDVAVVVDRDHDRGAPEAKRAPSPPPPEAVSPGTPTTRDSWLVEPLPDVTPPHNSPPSISETKSGEEGLLEWIEDNGASKFKEAILDVAGDLDDLKHITEQDFEDLVKGMPKLKARRLRASLVELGARLA